MKIGELIHQIPETSDEALLAIAGVILYPYTDTAHIRCHLTHRFHLYAALEGAGVRVWREGYQEQRCSHDTFVGTLKRVIHEIDEGIEAGRYLADPPPKTQFIFDSPTPPDDMDIPVWDSISQQWYDAEY